MNDAEKSKATTRAPSAAMRREKAPFPQAMSRIVSSLRTARSLSVAGAIRLKWNSFPSL